MAPSPLAVATVQSSILAATANLLAQALMAYRKNSPLTVDWIPVVQFVLYAIISTPPNFMWQEFLEAAYPAYHISPTPKAVGSASAGDEKSLDREAEKQELVEPKLNKLNTAAKFFLDQTLGAAANTFLFSLFIHAIKAAMKPSSSAGGGGALLAIDYSLVDWAAVVSKSQGEFWTMMVASWQLWPLVSLVNYTVVHTITGRNLVSGMAGVAWGIYVSLLTSSRPRRSGGGVQFERMKSGGGPRPAAAA